MARSSAQTRPVSAQPATAPATRVAGTSSDGRVVTERAALIQTCIYVRDRVTSRALADRLAAALRDAGVNVVEPVGDRFDPAGTRRAVPPRRPTRR